MHYRNGREAKPGDRAVNVVTGDAGIVYNINAQATSCNARLAATTPTDPYVTLSECVHMDDVTVMFPDRSKAVPQAPLPQP